LETPRLLLRALELADAEQAQPLFAQWEVVRYLANKVTWPFPSDGVYKFYRDVALPQAERGEAWHWTLRLKSAPDRLIGCISLPRGRCFVLSDRNKLTQGLRQHHKIWSRRDCRPVGQRHRFRSVYLRPMPRCAKVTAVF
jgi:hypothetical protein